MTLLRHRPWPGALRLQHPRIALDMGSARTRAWIAGRGLILDVPTVTFPGAGAVRPIQRGTIIDVPGTARMLQRLLAHRLPRLARPLIVVAAPVLDGLAYRSQARAAVQALRPRSVLTIPSARAIAHAAGADLSRPLIVIDIGAHLTEVTLLVDGAVHDARRTALGTDDTRDQTAGPTRIGEALADMTASMLRQDRTSLTADALALGPLLAGGGALHPDITHRLADRLHVPLRPVPAPHTAAVRGAALLLKAVHTHPTTAHTHPSDPPR
ncbi:rod shape-determining protein [Streptomyces sp. NPDC059897]|uniref:rod shape-determining protein n=1 Tax=Streptomyces sp. NPDC059897 TaxID=3346994 RepID=UPI0036517B51